MLTTPPSDPNITKDEQKKILHEMVDEACEFPADTVHCEKIVRVCSFAYMIGLVTKEEVEDMIYELREAPLFVPMSIGGLSSNEEPNDD
jgi:hypothetical protein